MKATAILLALAVFMLLAGAVLATNGLAIPRQLIGSGGGSVQDGGFALQGSIGQAVAGGVDRGSFRVGSGFWAGAVRVEQRIYLPLILRNAS